MSDDHRQWMRPGPEHDPPPAAPPIRGGAFAEPTAPDRPAPRRRRVPRAVIAVGAATVVLAVAGVVAVRASSTTGGGPKPTAAVVTGYYGKSLDPEDQAWKVAQSQVDALLGHNEQDWLALVDPAQPEYVERYRNLFRTLRAMKVDTAEALAAPPPGEAGAGNFFVGFSYCFAGGPCPGTAEQSKMVKRVTIRTVEGRLVMTTLDWNPQTAYNLKAPPWADDHLVVAEGKRVVVGASASQAANLPRIVAYADRAAVDLDHFGKFLRTAQDRYRIFLADDQDWATWYGGDQPTWSIGYAWEPSGAGMDVILHAGAVLDGVEDPQVVVRHEMGHVLTTIQAQPPADPLAALFNDPNQWLREGIAEYIGQNARPPQQTDHRYALQAAFRSSDPPTSIMAQSVAEGSGRSTVNSLYAMGYFATSCMAATYGEAKLFHFTDLVLRQDTKADKASRAVYGKPFQQVDRTCLGWLKHRI